MSEELSLLKELKITRLSRRASIQNYKIMVAHSAWRIAWFGSLSVAVVFTGYFLYSQPGSKGGAVIIFVSFFLSWFGFLYAVMSLVFAHRFFEWGKDTMTKTYYEPRSEQPRIIPVNIGDQSYEVAAERPPKTIEYNGAKVTFDGYQLDRLQTAVQNGDTSIRRDPYPGLLSFTELGFDHAEFTDARYVLIQLEYVKRSTGQWTIKGVLWLTSQ